jgi:hypothetical protein
LKPGMLNRYNLINQISVALAGITGSLYLYKIFPIYFKHPASTALLYAVGFFMICFFAGRVKRTIWKSLDNNWFYALEGIIFLGFPVYSFLNGSFNYWDSAGIILLGYIIIFTSSTIRENIIKLIMVIISPVFYFGMIYQNSYFTETVFAISFLLLMDRIFKGGLIGHYFIMSALILAFLIFINPFLALLFIAFSTYSFRQNLKQEGAFLAIVFIAYYFLNSFLTNRISVLTLPLPAISIITAVLLILFLLLAVYSGWIGRTVYEIFFSSSVIMAVVILIFSSDLFSLNILFLSTLFPLLIFSVRDQDTKEYLGIILED